MTVTNRPPAHIGRSVARCRLILSAVALMAVVLDPTQPFFARWDPAASRFPVDPYALVALLSHLGYSLIILALLSGRRAESAQFVLLTTWIDVGFGALIALFTEGAASPFYAFFAFAVVEAGLIGGFRRTLAVTAVSVLLYVSMILISAPGGTNFYIMRPIYLAVAGYLVGYLGQQRLNLEAGIRELAASAQRQQIARDLHDGGAQALAGIGLRLESCQELLRRGRATEALLELGELHGSVNREYDELRTYMRSLAGLETTGAARAVMADIVCSVRTDFGGAIAFVDQVLQIMREGLTNVARHARARSATLSVQQQGADLRITIDDDGVGFQAGAPRPWSIASRVDELGGVLETVDHGAPGAHLAITLPRR